MSFRKRLEDALNRLVRRRHMPSAYDRLVEAVIDVAMDLESYAHERAAYLAVPDLDETEFKIYCGIDGWPQTELLIRAQAGFDLHESVFVGIPTPELKPVYLAAFGKTPPQMLTDTYSVAALRAKISEALNRREQGMPN